MVDVDAGQIEIASIPAQVLTVEDQPLPADDQPEDDKRNWKALLLSLANAALLNYLK